MGYNFQLSERSFFLARPEAKLCGSGQDWPLSTDLCRSTPPEKIRSAQVAFESRARLGTVRSSCKIRVVYENYR